jgi:hypothetical protein
MRVRWRPILRRIFAVLAFSCAFAHGQDGELDPSQPKNITPNEIIQCFTAKRKRMEATTRAIHLSAISSIPGDGRRPGGWRISASRADISYAQGKRVKTVVLAPQPSVVLSPEDVEDIETRASFTISSDELPQPRSPLAAMSFHNTTCSTWASKSLMSCTVMSST